MGVFSKFKGKLLVADAHPVVLEGEWPRDKVVIMEFPDDTAAQEFQTRRNIRRSRSIGKRAPTRCADGERAVLNGRSGLTSYPRELRECATSAEHCT